MPVKLLTEMSESTAGGNRLSFVVEWDARNASLERFGLVLKAPCQRERGFRTPGCLTSEDEERETWTAESLRISEYLKASAFRFSGSDERLRRYTFKGYTIVARDVNRRQLVGFG